MGAILVLASHVIDLSTQSMITFPPCDGIQQEISGIVPRTNNFTLTGKRMDEGTQEMLALPFQQMIYGGIMGLNLSSYLRPSCITGNCSVDPFWTIGYSSECFNASDELQISSDQSSVPTDTYRWPEHGLEITVKQDIASDGGPDADPLLATFANRSILWGSQIHLMLTDLNTTVYAVKCNLSPSLQKFSSDVVSILYSANSLISTLISVINTVWQ